MHAHRHRRSVMVQRQRLCIACVHHLEVVAVTSQLEGEEDGHLDFNSKLLKHPSASELLQHIHLSRHVKMHHCMSMLLMMRDAMA